MEKVGIFYAHLKYITAIWYLFLALCNLMTIWKLLTVLSRKIWQPCTRGRLFKRIFAPAEKFVPSRKVCTYLTLAPS
jgi:hypothetical protein